LGERQKVKKEGQQRGRRVRSTGEKGEQGNFLVKLEED